jgi:hypothetical protein
VAQLGARQTGSLKVRGSNPLGSTIVPSQDIVHACCKDIVHGPSSSEWLSSDFDPAVHTFWAEPEAPDAMGEPELRPRDGKSCESIAQMGSRCPNEGLKWVGVVPARSGPFLSSAEDVGCLLQEGGATDAARTIFRRPALARASSSAS